MTCVSLDIRGMCVLLSPHAYGDELVHLVVHDRLSAVSPGHSVLNGGLVCGEISQGYFFVVCVGC